MTKYYVTTGPYKIVLLASNSLEAAEKGIKKFVDQPGKFRPSRFTNVSEVGFCMDDEESSPDHKLDQMYESETLAEDLHKSIIEKLKRRKK